MYVMNWVCLSTNLALKRNEKWIDVARLNSLVLADMFLIFKLIAHFQDKWLNLWKMLNLKIKPFSKIKPIGLNLKMSDWL